jgi:hypothetical protein
MIKAFRRKKIEEHSTDCFYCGHHHNPYDLIAKFTAREKGFTSLYCHNCKRYHRLKMTKEGLISVNDRISRDKGKSSTIRQDRMNCAHCDHPVDREDFDFLLKKKNNRRTTCHKCKGPLILRRTALGFYTTGKADYKRLSDNTDKGINRLEYDPTEKRFKLLRHRYPLKKKEQCQK